MGILKEKIPIKLFDSYPGLKKKPCFGNHFWAKGYFVNTVDLGKEMIRKYVIRQEKAGSKINKSGLISDLYRSLPGSLKNTPFERVDFYFEQV